MNNNGIHCSNNPEPDIEIIGYAGRARSPVAIIEVKVTPRSGSESRRQAAKYFENESVKLVMLVKVYPRRLIDQCFAAICVIWGQNNHGGPITCLEAHDFGTRAMHRLEMALFKMPSQTTLVSTSILLEGRFELFLLDDRLSQFPNFQIVIIGTNTRCFTCTRLSKESSL